MTETQRARLPEILRDIVDTDRALADVRAQLAVPVVPLAVVRAARGKLLARREQTAVAEQLYGPRLGGGTGPARA